MYCAVGSNWQYVRASTSYHLDICGILLISDRVAQTVVTPMALLAVGGFTTAATCHVLVLFERLISLLEFSVLLG